LRLYPPTSWTLPLLMSAPPKVPILFRRQLV
jgi:hypothetical protein